MLYMEAKQGQHLGPQHPVSGADGQETRAKRRHHVERHCRRQSVRYEGRRDDEEQGGDPENCEDGEALERGALLFPPLRGRPGQV